MSTTELPDSKVLTFFSEGGQKQTPRPFSKDEILSFPEVKTWLAKGYDLDTFENKLSPKDAHQIILLVLLTRQVGSGEQ
jgi:hypothetical protein